MRTEERLTANYTAEDKRMLQQAETVKQQLNHCMANPGATISIAIAHDDGSTAVANLYDHAALVQALYLALDEFISEL